MLQDLNYIKKYLTNNLEFDFRGEEEEHPVPYRWSHGATDVHLGDGLIVDAADLRSPKKSTNPFSAACSALASASVIIPASC